jgi:ubiquinone biosynthesis protein COQ9
MYPPAVLTQNLKTHLPGKEVTTNTDPITFDWNEVEILMIQLEKEKRHLAETLEKERKARMELAREQGEQMEQLVTQLAVSQNPLQLVAMIVFSKVMSDIVKW